MGRGNFMQLQNELFSIFQNGDDEKIVTLIEKIKSLYPERKEKYLFWEACFFATRGQISRAVSALMNGINQGIWWNPNTLKGDPDLKNIQSDLSFLEIIRICEERLLNEKHKRGQCKLFTYGSSESDIALFILHWRGSNVTDFSSFWLDEYTIANYYFGFPQSSQIHSYNNYCWDDPSRTKQDIELCLQQFQPLSKSFILAGASQGGKVAFEYFLKNQDNRFDGLILVIPSIQKVSEYEEMVRKAKTRSNKIFIITGDQDYFYKDTMELVSLLKDYHFDCQIHVIKGLGHYFPNDFTRILEQAVDTIRGNNLNFQ